MRDEDVGRLEMTVTEARQRVAERLEAGEIDFESAKRRQHRLSEISSGKPLYGMRQSAAQKRKLAATTAEA